jgi:hypothetical protein
MNHTHQMIMNKHKAAWKKLLITVAAVLSATSITVFALEKTHVIDLFKQSSSQNDQSNPPNAVNYSPPTAEEVNDPTINSVKAADGTTPTPTISSIGLIITRAGQDTSNKSIYVGTMVQGATDGTCTLQILQNNAAVYAAQAPVVRQNNLYVCSGFSIDIVNIPASGSLVVNVTLSVGSESTSSTQTINDVVK